LAANGGVERRPQKEIAFHDQLVVEISKLNSDFGRLTPPKLNEVGQLWIDPLSSLSASESITWLDRIDVLQSYRKWTSTTEHSKTIDGNLDEYLAFKKAIAKTGQIKPGWYDLLAHRLTHFRTFAGSMSLNQLNARTLTSFHGHLIQRIADDNISQAYAAGILTSVKTFLRWLWKSEAIENLPRNIDDLHIKVELEEIIPFTKTELVNFLGVTSGRSRLYLLLMLNCGYYQQDIADLKHTDVDWQHGRIFRKRSKTAKKETVPKVNYKLWEETFALLKNHRSDHPTLVLVNRNGSPLRRRGFGADGKTQNVDNIKKVYERVCNRSHIPCRPLKTIRKTGSSKLEEHDVFGRFSQYYLGQAPQTVAESRYARPSEEQFDRALKWLGEQFDLH
jgi:integrase